MRILGRAKRAARERDRVEKFNDVVIAAIAAFPTLEKNRFLNDESMELYNKVRYLIEMKQGDIDG